uniref:Uncharacterized protein n=1 Tax=Rhizophora mucronata TaxID=61149 RepID=A0A2P2Q5C6_RHIMU
MLSLSVVRSLSEGFHSLSLHSRLRGNRSWHKHCPAELVPSKANRQKQACSCYRRDPWEQLSRRPRKYSTWTIPLYPSTAVPLIS